MLRGFTGQGKQAKALGMGLFVRFVSRMSLTRLLKASNGQLSRTLNPRQESQQEEDDTPLDRRISGHPGKRQ